MTRARNRKAFSPDLLRDLHAEPALKPLAPEEVEVLEGRNLPAPLSGHEVRIFSECERIIDQGLNTFVEVGQALAEIRDRRLYRSDHRTFEAYCQQKWGLKRQRAYEMMGASQVAGNLSGISDILPAKESHAAALLKLSPDDQRETWSEIITEHPGGHGVTAATIKDKIAKRKPRPEPTPEQAALAEFTAPLGKALRGNPDQIFITISGTWLVRNNLEHVWRELRGVTRMIDPTFSDVITLGEAFELGLLRPIK